MTRNAPRTVLCISTYEKGQEFMTECKRQGAAVVLLTSEKLRHADWPWDSLDDFHCLPAEAQPKEVLGIVNRLMRSRKVDCIVALDEYDKETAATLREHLRIPGMGLTTLRHYRDKLAMRLQAHEKGILVPDFVPLFHDADIAAYLSRVPGPWIVKPRFEASAIGLRKIHAPEEIWRLLEELGEQHSYCLLEKFVPGEVYHVDSIVSERQVVFAEASRYGTPPMKVSHEGGVFTTRMLSRLSEEAIQLIEVNHRLVKALGLVRGVTHAEFIRAEADGRFYFLECAARVGGAYIVDMLEAATGVNLWREWAHIELAGGNAYQPPVAGVDFAGVVLTLARQEYPDTSAYTDPEVAKRISKYHHAGLVVRSPDADRVRWLVESYSERFAQDFMASQPVPDKPTS